MELQGHEKWSITGSWKTSVTVDEMADYTIAKGGGTGGLTEEVVDEKVKNSSDALKVDIGKKADQTSLNTTNVNVSKKAEKTDLDATNANVAKKCDVDLMNSELDNKVDKTSLNKSSVGLSNVDNTSDANKPVSTAQKVALDGKVDVFGLFATLFSTLPTQHTGEPIDLFELGYGAHTINANNAVNAPPETKVNLVWCVKTHDNTPSNFPFVDIPEDAWEQGTVSQDTIAGNTREYITRPNATLDSSRLRTKTIRPIEEFGNVRLTTDSDYYQYITYFDENELTMGKFSGWTSYTQIAPEGAKYFMAVIRRVGNTAVTPEGDVSKFKVGLSKGDPIRGEGKILIAWGATKGDLHTCVGNNGAFFPWETIGSALPKDAEEGSSLKFIEGKWVAVSPTKEI